MDLNIRECGDDLLLGRKIGALLELEITYCTGQGEIAVYATEVDKASCGLDTCLLGWKVSVQSFLEVRDRLTFVLRLVIERKWLCTTLHAEDSTRVTRVCLAVLDCSRGHTIEGTYDVDLILGKYTD